LVYFDFEEMRMKNRLGDLRERMATHNVDAYLVPRTDEFQGEYVAPYAERLAWLTGFTGSAGFAVATKDKAAFFTDGRYTLQAQLQVNGDNFDRLDGSDTNPAQWLSNQKNIKTIGFDPWLFTASQLDAYKEFTLIPTQNLIDALWTDQESRPQFFAVPHDVRYAGEDDASKRTRIGKTLDADYVLFTLSDSIAWLLNIRGCDVPHTPVCHCYVLMDKSGQCEIFIDPHKINADAERHMKDQGRIIAIDAMTDHLAQLPQGSSIQLDPRTCPVFFRDFFEKQNHPIVLKNDPCILPKAIKNNTELDGTRHAHIRDGAALVEFMHWLSEQPLKSETTELTCVDKLLEFRKRREIFKDLSFDTIAGFGSHGAIIHYRADESSDIPLMRDNLFLLDSGAQYLDGTTDVTRTLALGTPTAEQKDAYTRVLKGHVAIATVTFPHGTTGAQLDILARHALWQVGLDYAHGTGHGVGSYLAVHEGPQNISKGASPVPLVSGMILSNEPGFYKEGGYGIRIESLVIVKDRADLAPGFMGFETITLAPLDRALIEVSLLTQDDVKWINTYHRDVYTKLSPYVNDPARIWLEKACEPI